MDNILVFLGTSSGAPIRPRNVSACVWRVISGQLVRSYLFDAGEATQTQIINNSALSFSHIKAIFITHLHGDHINGLTGE